MKLLLFVLTLAAAVSGFTTAEHRNRLPFISNTRPQLSFASGRSTSGLRETLFKRGSLQKLNLNQDDNTNKDNKAIMVEKQNKKKILDTIHIFGTNLILQVFGGAEAIWGFSEVIGVRTPESVWFWRPTAQFVGAIFFLLGGCFN